MNKIENAVTWAIGLGGFILAVVCVTMLFFVTPHHPPYVLGMGIGILMMLYAIGRFAIEVLVP